MDSSRDPISDLSGTWHLLDLDADEQHVPDHRMDLRLVATPDGLDAAILNRVTGERVPFAAARLDGAELRLQMHAPPAKRQDEMPWLVMSRVGGRFEGHWRDARGEPVEPRVKLVRSPSDAAEAAAARHPPADPRPVLISVMLAVSDAPEAVAWYKRALGATELWSLGSVAGLEIAGAPFFVVQPESNGWESPRVLGTTSARVEVFCDDPDAFVARAVREGANGDGDPVRDHQTLWGVHRQGGFIDPFGHIWLVGDKSPLRRQR